MGDLEGRVAFITGAGRGRGGLIKIVRLMRHVK